MSYCCWHRAHLVHKVILWQGGRQLFVDDQILEVVDDLFFWIAQDRVDDEVFIVVLISVAGRARPLARGLPWNVFGGSWHGTALLLHAEHELILHVGSAGLFTDGKVWMGFAGGQ